MDGGLWKREIVVGSPDGAPKRSTLDTDATSRFASQVKKYKKRQV
jgi:hypothetical protein